MLQLRNEGDPEVMEELITVDAIGCFEGEDDYEEDRNEEEVAVFEKVSCMISCALLNLSFFWYSGVFN